MDSSKDKLKTPTVPEVDLQKLLGFDRVDAEQMEVIKPEDAAAIAFNKRGEAVPSDRRLKADVRPISETADGLPLYAFRYIGDDREFCGVMAQDLLANPRHADAVMVAEGGYFRVDYDKLGLGALVTPAMREAGAQAMARALAA